MTADGFMFFTETHKLYVQGVRRAICQRLQSAFGDEWWERGVELALRPEQRESLRSQVERRPGRDRQLLLDVSHFGWIIVNHHNEVFSDAFRDTLWAANEIRFLTNLRNEWAHVQDIPLTLAKRAADSMKSILASLRCEEALEIERMSDHLDIQPGDMQDGHHVDDLTPDPPYDTSGPAAGPWELWRQLRSYLVVDKSIEFFDDERRNLRRAQVAVRVHNTAPDSGDWPAVHFKSVQVNVTGGDSQDLGSLEPGGMAEAEFTFPAMQLVDIDIQVEYQIDGDRLWGFRQPANLPAEVIGPLQQEFVNRLEAIGVKEFVNRALEEIGVPDQSMTLADIARIRSNIQILAPGSREKREALGALADEFSLSRASTLGGRTREIVRGLVEFEENLASLDQAIGLTDLDLITQAVSNLQQIQLSVLRVEDAIRTMSGTVLTAGR